MQKNVMMKYSSLVSLVTSLVQIRYALGTVFSKVTAVDIAMVGKFAIAVSFEAPRHISSNLDLHAIEKQK